MTVRLLQSLGSPNKADEGAVNKLRLQIMQLEDMVTHLSETQSSFAPNGTTGMRSSWVPPSCSMLRRLSCPRVILWNNAQLWLMLLMLCNWPIAGSSFETAPAADFEEAVQALEERALQRQTRLEAALLQVT